MHKEKTECDTTTAVVIPITEEHTEEHAGVLTITICNCLGKSKQPQPLPTGLRTIWLGLGLGLWSDN